MNQIKLSLRCGDDPRVIREENGVPAFVTVFAIHNPFKRKQSAEIALPITVKAFGELAAELASQLSKGTCFTVEGQPAYCRHPESWREFFSIRADKIADVIQARVRN